jgi:hypothetical protein
MRLFDRTDKGEDVPTPVTIHDGTVESYARDGEDVLVVLHTWDYQRLCLRFAQTRVFADRFAHARTLDRLRRFESSELLETARAVLCGLQSPEEASAMRHFALLDADGDVALEVVCTHVDALVAHDEVH